MKYFICQIRNSLEDLKLLQEMQLPAPFFSSRETSSTLLALGSRVLSVLMFCHQPRMTLTSRLTHSALTRTGALINRHRLYFQVFSCVDLPELIPRTNLARNKTFVLAEQSVLLYGNPDIFQTEVDCMHSTAVCQINVCFASYSIE